MTPEEIRLVAAGGLAEFARDPLLTVACVLLAAVSLAWILTARAISKNIRRAAAEARRRSTARRTQGRRSPPPASRTRGARTDESTQRIRRTR